MKTIIISLLLCFNPLFGLANGLTYSIDPSKVLYTVSESFVSVALDTGLLASANLSNPAFSKLVKHLSPMHFRIGGTAADVLSFVDDSDVKKVTSKVGDDLVLRASFWLKLAEFAKNSDVKLLFDLNSLLRNENGSWNSENAVQMIKFSREHDIELDWELGNEPDLYQAIYSRSVSADQLASDYSNLRAILDLYEYNSSYLVGPSMFDVGSSDSTKSYLTNFLTKGSSSIDAVTWHQYYFNGRDATEELFLNPATFNYLEQRTKVVTGIVGSSKKVWLGETSSCYNQGAAGMSDRVLASFLWLDKLGLGAKLGLDVIVRQTIWGYNYPLLNVDYSPNPDWWISVIYKKLVGTKVLSMTNAGEDTTSVRLYAHCAKPGPLWGDNAVVVFGINVANSSQSFRITGVMPELPTSIGFLHDLTSESDLYSRSLRLNGEILELDENLEIPYLTPKLALLNDASEYTMPAYSLIFWVLPNSKVKACY